MTDATPKSARAIVNARRLLEEHLGGRYSLEILNIAEHVAQATEDQIVCVPTLLRLAPPPARRIIGDMSDVGARAQGTRRPAGALSSDVRRTSHEQGSRRSRHRARRRADDELARLRRANVELESRLIEAEDTLAAIRNGDVDALIVGEDIYTLDSANAASNAMRKDVLAQMQDAVLAFDVDDHVIFMNPAAERQYGCVASEVLGRPRGDLFRERWADAERAMRAREQLRTQRQLSGGVGARARRRPRDACRVHRLAAEGRAAAAARLAVGDPQHRRPRRGAGHAGRAPPRRSRSASASSRRWWRTRPTSSRDSIASCATCT